MKTKKTEAPTLIAVAEFREKRETPTLLTKKIKTTKREAPTLSDAKQVLENKLFQLNRKLIPNKSCTTFKFIAD